MQELFLWFINLFSYVARSCTNFFSFDFGLPEFFFLLWAHLPHHFSNGPSLRGRRKGDVKGGGEGGPGSC